MGWGNRKKVLMHSPAEVCQDRPPMNIFLQPRKQPLTQEGSTATPTPTDRSLYTHSTTQQQRHPNPSLSPQRRGRKTNKSTDIQTHIHTNKSMMPRTLVTLENLADKAEITSRVTTRREGSQQQQRKQESKNTYPGSLGISSEFV